MEKLGADDLMPAFMYSLVKANVPNLYSELQFLNEFVVERNYSSDEFNHYLMTRKRMSDLEAALHFINSIDMNVRDEKNALVPVTTMVDRVIDILHVGVAECLERKVVSYWPQCFSSMTWMGSATTSQSSRLSVSLKPLPFHSCFIHSAFSFIALDATHTLDIRIISQNQQPAPQVVWTTAFSTARSRSQPVSLILKPLVQNSTLTYSYLS
jgi:hypothetical protein